MAGLAPGTRSAPPAVLIPSQCSIMLPCQTPNSDGHCRGTNAICIFSPCRGKPHSICLGSGQQIPTAQSCSTTRAPPAPSPRDVPPARAGRTLLLPYPSLWGHGTVTRGAPWDIGDAQLQPCLPRALPQLLHCLTCSGLTGSARAPRLPRLSPKLASLPCTAEHPGAQTQHYLSRMRKSSTIRTMGRKMRSRLNSSATSSRASSRR